MPRVKGKTPGSRSPGSRATDLSSGRENGPDIVGNSSAAPFDTPYSGVYNDPSSRALEGRMDVTVNQLARELAEAISAAVAEDARVEAIREKARAEGFDMKVSLEAVIGFVNRNSGNTPAKVA